MSRSSVLGASAHDTEAAQDVCRPCSMTIPDYALVAEVILFSEGRHSLGHTQLNCCAQATFAHMS